MSVLIALTELIAMRAVNVTRAKCVKNVLLAESATSETSGMLAHDVMTGRAAYSRYWNGNRHFREVRQINPLHLGVHDRDERSPVRFEDRAFPMSAVVTSSYVWSYG